MNMIRVWAITHSYVRQVIKDMTRLAQIFYWSFIELALIGFMAIWTKGSSSSSVVFSLMAAAIVWSLINRVSLEMPFNMLEELWAHNLLNLFVSPLTIAEWMVSSALYAAIVFVPLLFFLWGLAYSMFGYNFFSVGWMLVPLLFNYYISALVIGFLTAAILIRYGLRATSYVFMISWIFAPMSGIYYSLSVLPVWVQYVAHLLPTYYGIDVLKTFVVSGEIVYWKLAAAFAFNALYLVLTLVLFKWMFEKSRQEGLTRLTNG